jgi:hypothetical protein
VLVLRCADADAVDADAGYDLHNHWFRIRSLVFPHATKSPKSLLSSPLVSWLSDWFYILGLTQLSVAVFVTTVALLKSPSHRHRRHPVGKCWMRHSPTTNFESDRKASAPPQSLRHRLPSPFLFFCWNRIICISLAVAVFISIPTSAPPKSPQSHRHVVVNRCYAMRYPQTLIHRMLALPHQKPPKSSQIAIVVRFTYN